MQLKRTNWTTEEVIKLLDGQKLCNVDGKEPEDVRSHNVAIDMAKNFFGDFLRPQEEFGAMAYDAEKDVVYHIGCVPDEASRPNNGDVGHSP